MGDVKSTRNKEEPVLDCDVFGNILPCRAPFTDMQFEAMHGPVLEQEFPTAKVLLSCTFGLVAYREAATGKSGQGYESIKILNLPATKISRAKSSVLSSS